MSYQAALVVAGIQGAEFQDVSICRTVDGFIYVVYYDRSRTTPGCAGFFSLSEGQVGTWFSETWSTAVGADVGGTGGTDPHLVVDPVGRIYLATSTYNGTDSPYALMRDSESRYWGSITRYFSGVFPLSTKKNVTSFSAVMDHGTPTAGAYFNIASAFISAGNAYYGAVNTFPTDETIDPTGNILQVQLTATSGGTKTAVYRDSNNDLWAKQKSLTGGWSARLPVDTGVTNLDQVVVNITTQPTALYHKGSDLYISEFDNITSSFTVTQVPGVWIAGSTMGYDQRGSIHVGGSDGTNMVNASLLRAVGATTWVTSAGVQGLPLHVMDNQTPRTSGYESNRLSQGHLHIAMAAVGGNHDLYVVNPDRYDDAQGPYPTIFNHLGGEPEFRAGDNLTRTPITLVPESGLLSADFPSIRPSYTYRESPQFYSSVATFDLGYRSTILQFQSGRRLIDVRFQNIGDNDKNLLVDFVRKRQEDFLSFDWLPPDEEPGAELEVVVTGTPIRVSLEGEETKGGVTSTQIWTVTFQMLEVV